MSNARYQQALSAVSRENHPELLGEGEGIAKVTASDKQERSLKLAAHRATAALKEFQIMNAKKPTAPKPAKKTAATSRRTPTKPKGA